jgi:hypothetical protein
VNGQGLGGVWHVMAPTGVVITKAARPASTPSAAGAGTGSSSGGYGSGSSGSGSSGSSGGSRSGGGSTTPNDCQNNPGGYGCM